MNKIMNPPRESWDAVLQRPGQSFEDVEVLVRDVFRQVREEGDVAVGRFTSKFDGVDLQQWELPADQLQAAGEELSTELKQAIGLAKGNIEKFHRAQLSAVVRVETSEGVECWQEKKPIDKVGLYIPGGSAPLFSTVLMLAIPAVLAGCREIILCSPPDREGRLHPAIIYTAKLCGIDRIYMVGYCSNDFRNPEHPGGIQNIRPRQPICYRGQTAGHELRSGHRYAGRTQ